MRFDYELELSEIMDEIMEAGLTNDSKVAERLAKQWLNSIRDDDL